VARPQRLSLHVTLPSLFFAQPGGEVIRSGASTVVRDAVALAPAYAVPGIASLASVPLLFMALGPLGYGSWALMYAIGQGVPALATSWAEATIVRFGHRPSFGLGIATAAASVVIATFVGALAAYLLLPIRGPIEVLATALLTASVSAYLVTMARLQSRLMFGLITSITVARTLVGLALSVLAAWWTADSALSIAGLAVGFVAASGLSEIRQRGPSDRSATEPAVAVSASSVGGDALGRYGAASFITALGLYVLSVGDRFILSGFRPLADVGVYAATYAIADLVFRFGPAIVLVPLRARLFRSWDEAGAGERGAELTTIASLLLWGAAWFVAAFVAVASVLRYVPVDAAIAGPIAAGISAFVVATALSLLYSAERRQTRLAIHTALAAAINVVANLLLVPRAGVLGAAFATALSYGVLLALHAIGTSDGRRLLSPRTALVASAGASALIATATAALWPAVWQPLLVAVVILSTAAVPALREARALIVR
jgi:O-antigen/teichoic acid export membrane protein